MKAFMLISGIQKFTLLDYPDKTACVVFTPGCDFRCGYCHNPEFVLPELIQKLRPTFIPETQIFSFLQKRKGLLDGVVISGGEPTMMGDLPDFMRRVKNIGFAVKLDTNGNQPNVLTQVLAHGLVDYIAMDIKTSLSTYAKLVGDRVRSEAIQKSIALIVQSGVDYEFRSTLIKEIHTDDVLEGMAELVRGARRLFLQPFRPDKTLQPLFASYHAFSKEEMEKIAKRFCSVVNEVEVR